MFIILWLKDKFGGEYQIDVVNGIRPWSLNDFFQHQ